MFTWLGKILEMLVPAPKSVPQGAAPRGHHPAAPVRVEPQKPAGPGIRYDPVLIQRLKDDHRVLLKAYGGIKTAAESGEWSTVEAALLPFRSGLTDHLMTESIKLYVYLQLTLASDRERLSLMRKFSAEMVGIGKVVLNFVDAHRDVSTDKDKQERFLQAWHDIGKTLGDRIAREEQTLYPMYDMQQGSVQ